MRLVGGDSQTVVAGLLLDGDHALLGDASGGVRALAADGTVRGSCSLGASIRSLLPIAGGAWAVTTAGELARVDANGARMAHVAAMPGRTLVAAGVCCTGIVRAFADGRVERFGADSAPIASATVAGRVPTDVACAGERVALGFADGTVQVDLGAQAVSWNAHTDGVKALVWTAAGATLATIGRDGNLAAWTERGVLRWRRDLGVGPLAALHDDVVGGTLLAFSADGHVVMVGMDGAPLTTLSAPTGQAASFGQASGSGDVALVVRGVGAFVAPLRAGSVLALAEARRGRSLSEAERDAYGLNGVVEAVPVAPP